MHPRIRLVAIALLTFTLTSRCAAAFAQQTVGEVTSITGVAKLDRGGNEVDLKLSMPIEIRDRLRTTAKAELTVTFRDGSKLVLSESSSYTVDQYAMTATTRRQALIRLWIGHLRAIVKMESGAPNSKCILPTRSKWHEAPNSRPRTSQTGRVRRTAAVCAIRLSGCSTAWWRSPTFRTRRRRSG
jgi:FecR protein